VGGGAGISNPTPKLLDPLRSNQLTQPTPMRLSQQRPSIYYSPFLGDTCSRSIAGIEGDKPHAASLL